MPRQRRYACLNGWWWNSCGRSPLRSRASPGEVNVAPFDVRWPEGNEADDDVRTVVQPDIIVLRKRPKLDARGCRGASDLIIEVLARAIAPMTRPPSSRPTSVIA
jgi:hypothetical protein